jgi:hypothetical protein
VGAAVVVMMVAPEAPAVPVKREMVYKPAAGCCSTGGLRVKSAAAPPALVAPSVDGLCTGGAGCSDGGILLTTSQGAAAAAAVARPRAAVREVSAAVAAAVGAAAAVGMMPKLLQVRVSTTMGMDYSPCSSHLTKR